MTDKKEDGWFGLKEKLFDFMLYIIFLPLGSVLKKF